VAKALGGQAEFISASDFDSLGENKYRVIVDRLSFQDPFLRQFVMDASLKGCYVINNPFSSEIINKIHEQKLAKSIGIRVPKTIVLPRMNPDPDVKDSAREPNWEDLRKKISLPCIVKTYNGYAWENVFVAASYREVENLYNAMKFSHILLVQEKIEYTAYFRVFCLNKKDVLICKWDPKPMGLGVYSHPDKKLIETYGQRLSDASIKMNSMLDLDINAIEFCIDEEGDIVMIEAMNEVPDINKNFLPADFYGWLVDRFAKCILEKQGSQETNRSIFGSAE
jgi:hypothetical protein